MSTLLPLWVEFFQDLELVRGRSRNTVLAYRRDLEVYAEFKEEHQDLSFIYEYLKKRGLSLRSQARVISSLRTYFRFCEGRGMKAPELRQLRAPRVRNPLPQSIDMDTFMKLFEAARVEDPHRTHRNQMCLLMLFGLGCRVSELIALDINDYNPTDAWLKVTGKGNKQRLVPVTDYLREPLRQYLTLHRSKLLKDKKTASILINERGQRPSRIDIWRWLAGWSRSAGFADPISPHRFRHGCATALLSAGADLRSIQNLLGHASIQTTQIYTQVSNQQLKSAIEEFHPLSHQREKPAR